MTRATRNIRYRDRLTKTVLRHLYGYVGFSIRDIGTQFGMGYSQVRDRIIYHNVEKAEKVRTSNV